MEFLFDLTGQAKAGKHRKRNRNRKTQTEPEDGIAWNIPKFKKHIGEDEWEDLAEEENVEGNRYERKHEDAENAQSTASSNSKEQASQFEDSSSKVKTFLNFLCSAASTATKAITETGIKIKNTIEEIGVLAEFNKLQNEFLKEISVTEEEGFPPWIGLPNEKSVREQCLSLSTERSNFLRNPPTGVDFYFSYEESFPVALAIMEEDPNLEEMHYKLVPMKINERRFWRNYFYRVNLICRANLDDKSVSATTNKLEATPQDLTDVQESMKKCSFGENHQEDWEKELEVELEDFAMDSEEDTGNSEENVKYMLDEVAAMNCSQN